METTIRSISGRDARREAINAAVELLRKGEVVALPTETVYGLAADALDPIAVAKIFEAKGRPRFDPLIVHLPNRDWLERTVDFENLTVLSSQVSADDRELILRLCEAFWPGPLTVVVPKRAIIPDIVTAGLDTVAVRISAHPVFSEIVRAFGKPLAAPSANRFGRISPTTSKHVFDELRGLIPLIVDGGPTTHGIESTIVAVREGKIEILRRGPVTSERLRGIGFQPMAGVCPPGIHRQDVDAPVVSAPGQLPSHYAPKTPLRIVDDPGSFKSTGRCALLAWNPVQKDKRFFAIRNLSESQDLDEAAANLFRYLRELDALDVDLIVAERVPLEGLGAAIFDRLQRASHA